MKKVGNYLRTRTLWLIILTVVAGAFRLYQVGSNPKILNRDEAALAYNAYLLKAAGVDEWNRPWPLALESFGDFKLPGYPWLLVGLFQVLPLTDWVVRLPSVVAGTLLIPVAYGLGRRFQLSPRLSVLVAILVATAPIFFFYSRIAYEANVGLFLFTTAVTLLLDSSPRHRFTDVIALILLVYATLTYNTPLLLLPFLVPVIIAWRGVKKWQSWFIPVAGSTIIFVVIMSLLLPLTSQKSGITIFSDESTWRAWTAFRDSLPPSQVSVLGSRYLYWAGLMATHLAKSFGPRFLVTEGGTHPWHSLPDYGHLYVTVYVAFIFGLVALLIHTIKKLLSFLAQRRPQLLATLKVELTLLYLLLVSLLPSIITVDSPHTTRSLFFLLLVVVIAVKGIEIGLKYVKFRWMQIAIAAVWLWEVILFFQVYYRAFPQQQQSWQPGFDQVIQAVERAQPTSEVAVVDGGGFHYILTAWYLKLPADRYLTTNVRQQPDKIGFRYGERVTHYHFIAQPQDQTNEQLRIFWTGTEWQVSPELSYQ